MTVRCEGESHLTDIPSESHAATYTAQHYRHNCIRTEWEMRIGMRSTH